MSLRWQIEKENKQFEKVWFWSSLLNAILCLVSGIYFIITKTVSVGISIFYKQTVVLNAGMLFIFSITFFITAYYLRKKIKKNKTPKQ